MTFRNYIFVVAIFVLAQTQMLAICEFANGQRFNDKAKELEERALKLDELPARISPLNLPNNKQLEGKLNSLVERLSELPDQVDSVSKSAQMQREFSFPLPDPLLAANPTPEQKEIARFQEYFIVFHIFLLNKHKEELAKRVEQKLPEDGYVSEDLKREINRSLHWESMIYMTSSYSWIWRTAESNKVNAFKAAMEMSRNSDRERSLMDSEGRIEVPEDYPEPSHEEIRLALVRHATQDGTGRKLAHDTFGLAYSLTEVLGAVAVDSNAGPSILLVVELGGVSARCERSSFGGKLAYKVNYTVTQRAFCNSIIFYPRWRSMVDGSWKKMGDIPPELFVFDSWTGGGTPVRHSDEAHLVLTPSGWQVANNLKSGEKMNRQMRVATSLIGLKSLGQKWKFWPADSWTAAERRRKKPSASMDSEPEASKQSSGLPAKYNQLDFDKDGMISKSEMDGNEVSARLKDRMFELIDTNGDELLDADEFEAFTNRSGRRRGGRGGSGRGGRPGGGRGGR